MTELKMEKNRRISESINLISPSNFKDSLNKFNLVSPRAAAGPVGSIQLSPKEINFMRATAGFNRKLTEPGVKYYLGADNARNRNSG